MQLLNKTNLGALMIKDKFISFANWAQTYWLALVIFLAVYWMLFLAMIALSWLFGYWYNAMHHVKDFDIASCWTGIQASAAAFLSIMGLAGASWAKYHTDSKFNSEIGKLPVEQTGKIIRSDMK